MTDSAARMIALQSNVLVWLARVPGIALAFISSPEGPTGVAHLRNEVPYDRAVNAPQKWVLKIPHCRG